MCEKPNTIGESGGVRVNVCEKPNTLGVCVGARANVCEKANTLGVCVGARVDVCEKPNTLGATEAGGEVRETGSSEGWRAGCEVAEASSCFLYTY